MVSVKWTKKVYHGAYIRSKLRNLSTCELNMEIISLEFGRQTNSLKRSNCQFQNTRTQRILSNHVIFSVSDPVPVPDPYLPVFLYNVKLGSLSIYIYSWWYIFILAMGWIKIHFTIFYCTRKRYFLQLILYI